MIVLASNHTRSRCQHNHTATNQPCDVQYDATLGYVRSSVARAACAWFSADCAVEPGRCETCLGVVVHALTAQMHGSWTDLGAAGEVFVRRIHAAAHLGDVWTRA